MAKIITDKNSIPPKSLKTLGLIKTFKIFEHSLHLKKDLFFAKKASTYHIFEPQFGHFGNLKLLILIHLTYIFWLPLLLLKIVDGKSPLKYTLLSFFDEQTTKDFGIFSVTFIILPLFSIFDK